MFPLVAVPAVDTFRCQKLATLVVSHLIQFHINMLDLSSCCRQAPKSSNIDVSCLDHPEYIIIAVIVYITA